MFVVFSAVVVLFGPLYGFDSGDAGGLWSTVWGEETGARWLVLAVAAIALGALTAAANGPRAGGLALAWLAVLVALPAAMSVGALMMPALLVVLVLLMRPAPAPAPAAVGTPGAPS